MSVPCLFDWGQDIQFCPTHPPYVNPLPLWLRTRYPVLPIPPYYINPLPLWLRTIYLVLPLFSTLCQSIASLIEDKISSSDPFLHLMSIHCLFDWGQDVQFCPTPPPYVNSLPLKWGQIFSSVHSSTLCQSVASLIENKISSFALSSTLCQPIASMIEDKISSSAHSSTLCQSIASLTEDKISISAPHLYLLSIHCLFFWLRTRYSVLSLSSTVCTSLFDWGQDIQFCPFPPPYVNPLPLWLRTRYPVLPISSTLCQSIASLIEDKISSSANLLHLMSIHCLFDWGQDIQFCPTPPPYVNLLLLKWGQDTCI